VRQPAEEEVAEAQVQVDVTVAAAVEENKLEIVQLKAMVKKLEKANKIKSSKLRRLRKLVKDAEVAKSEGKNVAEHAEKYAEIYNLDLDHSLKVLNPEEELPLKTPAETPKVKDKGKGILVETPKPMKKKDQIKMDAEYARKLQEEIDRDHDGFNKDIDWDATMDHLRKEMKAEDQEIIKSINETPAQKAAKRRKLSKEAQEAEDLRKRLEVVEDEDDDLLELMLSKRSKKNTKCVNAVSEELTAAKHKLMLLYEVCLPNFLKMIKSFITGIENLVDHKVKVIRCDNGTEFKNKEMSQFCKMKGIKRKFSISRTPQQNGVAERRNRTLIEAARTMLADSKLPTTFWAKAINIACYVQNRVLVVKPHNKTSYELFYGSGPDWLFDIDALTRTMNYEPIVASTQSNDFVGTKASDNVGQARKETEPVKDNILLPLWTDDPPFPQDPKSSYDDGFKLSSDDGKKVDEYLNVSIFNFSNDDEDDDVVADVNNLDTTVQVSPIPTTRIHKDHPLNQVIGDLQSATQTRNMTKNLEEHRLCSVSNGYQRCFSLRCMFCQPPGFKDLNFPDRVYKVKKHCMDYIKLLEPDEFYGRTYILLRITSISEERWHIISQDKYVGDILKKFGFTKVKITSTPMELKSLCSRIKMCKKQTVVANSTTEAEYVDASSCYRQVDGMEIIITELSVRRDLRLADEEGVDCLLNSSIFENLELMGYEKLS
nr:putative ribonuclease H-like domain-containing protein [Tanacetum cinerariifolium]